jgi:Domain of unknown function (DUF4159)
MPGVSLMTRFELGAGALTRRRFLGGAAASAAVTLAGLGAIPRRAHAIGQGSLFRIAEIGWAGLVPQSAPRSSGLSRLGTELAVHTSIEVARDNPLFVTLGQEKLFETPFLYLSGDRRFSPPTGRELESLRRHLTFGGFLLIDSSEGRAGGEFDTSVRQLVAELFPAPAAGLVTLSDDHVIYKSFYLLRSVAGRVAATRDLEALFLGNPGGGGSPGGRVAIAYCQNDLGGAWAKDTFGNYLYQCYPGGEEQREHAFRVGINLAMYALCLDYKTDQVHVPFILKRRRWRPGEP